MHSATKLFKLLTYFGIFTMSFLRQINAHYKVLAMTFEQANKQAYDLIATITNPSSFYYLKEYPSGLGSDEVAQAIATALNAGNEELDQSYNRGVLPARMKRPNGSRN